jgi:hypothetical protein
VPLQHASTAHTPVLDKAPVAWPLPSFLRIVGRKNMTIGNYPQKIANENILGLHYSRFPTSHPLQINRLPSEQSYRRNRIG